MFLHNGSGFEQNNALILNYGYCFRFLGALREAAAKITGRNRKRKRRYDYLNPASSRTQFLHS